MELGGWRSWETVRKHYLSTSLVPTPRMLEFYSWLTEPVAVVEPVLAVPAVVPRAAPPAAPASSVVACPVPPTVLAAAPGDPPRSAYLELPSPRAVSASGGRRKRQRAST